MGSGSFLPPPETKALGQSWLSGLGCLSPGKSPHPRPATPNLSSPVSLPVLGAPETRLEEGLEARCPLHLDSEDVGLCSSKVGMEKGLREHGHHLQTAVSPQGSLPGPLPIFLRPWSQPVGCRAGGGQGACCRQRRARPSPAFTEQWMCALDS